MSLLLLLIWCCGTNNQLVSDASIRKDYVLVDASKNLYCSKYEVTNLAYRQFLNHLKHTDVTTYEKCKVDSSKWIDVMGDFHPYARVYHAHPAFDDYPVVNISLFAAQQYCKWLTTSSKNANLLFRLPSQSEYEQLAKKTNVTLRSDAAEDYVMPNFNVRFILGEETVIAMPYNAKPMQHGPSHKFMQTADGIRHVIGNVSEYLNDGRSIGGNWGSYPSDVEIIQPYMGPNPVTGFRVWLQK